MPLSEWSERQSLIVTAGVMGGIILLLLGVLVYVWSIYKSVTDERDATQRTVIELEKKAKELDGKRSEFEDLLAQTRDVFARVPPTKDVDEFYRQLGAESRNARLRITGIDIVPPRTATGAQKGPASEYEPIQLKLECEGGYHDLGAFVNRIEERMNRLVAVTGFKIGAYKDGTIPGKRSHNILLEIETYRYNERQPAAASPAQPAAASAAAH